MRLKRFLFFAGVVGATAFFQATPSWAQGKIGYIEPQRILTQYKPFQEAQKEYGRYEEDLNREFTKMQNDFEKMKETYERQKLLLSEKRKQEEEQALMRKQEELQRLLNEVTDPDRGKLAQKQQELTAPILAQVNEVVATVAKESGYDFVLNTSGLVYANEDHDLTEKVLEVLLKEQAEAEQKTSPGR